MGKILVTPRSLTKNGHPYLKKIEEAGHEVIFPTPGVQPSEADLLRLLPECSGYLAGVEKISSRILASAKELRVISRYGTGIDNIDLAKAKELNIIIKTRPETCTKGMKQVKIYLSGLKREKLSDWKELSKGLWTARITLSVTDKARKAGKLTIMRRVDKEDLFKQELFPLE